MVKKIVIHLDTNRPEILRPLITFLTDMAGREELEIHLLLVSPVPFVLGKRGGLVSAPTERILEKIELEMLERFSIMTEAFRFLERAPETHIISGKLPMVITSLAAQIKADLIVMVTPPAYRFLPSWLGSGLSRVMSMTTVPVLALPAPENKN